MMTQNESLGRPENIARNSHGGHKFLRPGCEILCLDVSVRLGGELGGDLAAVQGVADDVGGRAHSDQGLSGGWTSGG